MTESEKKTGSAAGLGTGTDRGTGKSGRNAEVGRVTGVDPGIEKGPDRGKEKGPDRQNRELEKGPNQKKRKNPPNRESALACFLTQLTCTLFSRRSHISK